MKLFSILALISAAVCLSLAQELQEDVQEDELDLDLIEEVEVEPQYGWPKPGHGKCDRRPKIPCLYPGERTREDEEKCMTCKCNSFFYETCCEREPKPIVKKPRHCVITRKPFKCEYELYPKCKNACVIVGYETSVLEDYDEGWL